MRARARPWLVLPPANEDTALTMAAKLAGVAQGVPVCFDWNRKVGSHGRKVRHPTATATNEARAPRRHCGTAAPPLPGQPQQGGADQVERPVVGVEQQAGHRPDGDEVARTGLPQRPVEGQEAEHGEQHHQRVHPGLGGVAGGERRGGHEEHGRPAHPPPAQPAPGQPGQWHGGHADHPGQRPDRDIGGAEPAHPDVEQHVEQRGGAVTSEEGGELVERQPGDVDGQGLVEPQVRPGPEPQDHGGHHDHHRPDRDGHPGGVVEAGPLGVPGVGGPVRSGPAPATPAGRTGGRRLVPAPRRRVDREGLVAGRDHRGGSRRRRIHGPHGTQRRRRVGLPPHRGPWLLGSNLPPRARCACGRVHPSLRTPQVDSGQGRDGGTL